MKYCMVAVVSLGVLAATAYAQEPQTKVAPPAAPAAPNDLRQKASYSIGLNIGKSIKSQSLGLDPDLIAKGIKDALAGKPGYTDEQVQEVMLAFQQEVAAQKQALAAQKTKGDPDFLAANKVKPGVKTTATGLQYKALREGTGQAPAAASTVQVNYKGTLTDGTVFDSSYDRGKPAECPVNGVIKGWQEGLQLMKEGAKYQFVIPAALAYGEEGRPGIPPNATLVFEVELLKIVR